MKRKQDRSKPAQPAAIAWPGGARIVVALTFLMENWSEGTAPPYSPMTSPPKPGVPDRAGIQWSSYAGRAGIARLIQVARRHGMSGTVCINARSAELFPDTVKHILAAGFEVAGHNYAQDEVLPVCLCFLSCVHHHMQHGMLTIFFVVLDLPSCFLGDKVINYMSMLRLS